ncbi:tetrathionate reductase family octaheme c-type cytochrome [Prosthecochloris sp. N3]|uniref:Tetrathionate reductase family octaheme c-type cytochrome n=1 Tax=Prosthecochloris ethylica TaxID=2743976 RepID=A0ABR9XTC3_9CHLB|nr:tetrathionate reductase family octaheme c-type cytochrome [Prosthecochloris ethylica]MBF0587232.1 tetrathionate reductase family octaheme c-type cytochrome [Prosthecochloris ethylica]MBF0637305.1 tetrathionate reductase family octaheme c-type cytochrome [Prosthecochloris ethylica]NUK48394.1 tetrathionate reductase family octaheme c-type cytochrome [Prosthecochloris ethylica]
MKKLMIFPVLCALSVPLAFSSLTARSFHPSVDSVMISTADHTKFDQLKQDFSSGPEVTEACLECHTEAAKQVHQTKHWHWEVLMKDGRMLGKQHVVNNFCISVEGNEPRCTSCHIGYGWKDRSFDFTSERNVDCLVCHDGTGTYKKYPSGAGHPAYTDTAFAGKPFPAVDLSYVAQNVANPNRHNCGICHFEGGGGDAVKHGDLDNSLIDPTAHIDVHMSAENDGLDMTCIDCHQTEGHQVPGSRYEPHARDVHGFDYPLPDDYPTTCSSCHGLEPHTNYAKLDDHVDKLACQTCHIPTIARQRPTKMWWDWSKAGELDEKGHKVTRRDSSGLPVYMSKKGEFEWATDAVPEYRWFNGEMNYVTFLTQIDDSGVVPINHPDGEPGDSLSRIWPFKVHRGKQPYDSEFKRFVKPKLFGPKGSGAYWSDFDWDRAITTGMEYADMEYSGSYDFVETEMYWPISHMVTPKEEALGCVDCHRRNGRLEKLSGFYLPGRDANRFVEMLGLVVIAGSLAGVLVHGYLRFISYKRRSGEE